MIVDDFSPPTLTRGLPTRAASCPSSCSSTTRRSSPPAWSALKADYQVTCLEKADGAALERLAKGEFALVLLDHHLNGSPMTGLEFLQALEEQSVSVPVILLTGDVDPRVIREAINRAFKYVQKRPPLELLKVLKPLIDDGLEIFGKESSDKGDPQEALAGSRLIFTCPAMSEMYAQIARVAKSAQPVLIVGETGTGKDLVAREIHDVGPRRARPFGVVRCHTFEDDLLRDELFGHEIGFRGEGKLRKGKIEYASGGTPYLDDAGALPRALQDDLPRVLEEGKVTRLGDNEPISVDVRVLAASRSDLRGLPETRFRSDLLSQLSVIRLPALRERSGDLEKLAKHFLQQETARAGKCHVPALAAECWDRLRNHSWPGNVRELQTVHHRRGLRHEEGHPR